MRIWKWTLQVTDNQKIQMPLGAKILSVQVQHGAPQVWAMVDETAPQEWRSFATYGTGNPQPDIAEYGRFIGTYQLNGGGLVFHVFEQP